MVSHMTLAVSLPAEASCALRALKGLKLQIKVDMIEHLSALLDTEVLTEQAA